MTQTKPARKGTSRWSARVTRESDALDLSRGVFTWKDPKRIAGSLKRSAERSKRRKSDPYRSALSMLTFYLNRAGKKLPAAPAQDAAARQGGIAQAFRPWRPSARGEHAACARQAESRQMIQAMRGCRHGA
jgi:hypothetical protein